MSDPSKVESDVARILAAAAQSGHEETSAAPDSSQKDAPTPSPSEGRPVGGAAPAQEAMWLAMGVPPHYYQRYKDEPGRLAQYRDSVSAGSAPAGRSPATFLIGPLVLLGVFAFLLYRIAGTGLFEKLNSIR